jgi:beta-lactamase class A
MLESTSRRSTFSMFLCIICVLTSLTTWLPAQTSPTLQQNMNEKQAVLWEKLAARINEIDQTLDGVTGIAILDLTSGRTFLSHADDVFPQASSIKMQCWLSFTIKRSTAARETLNSPTSTPSKALT